MFVCVVFIMLSWSYFTYLIAKMVVNDVISDVTKKIKIDEEKTSSAYPLENFDGPIPSSSSFSETIDDGRKQAFNPNKKLWRSTFEIDPFLWNRVSYICKQRKSIGRATYHPGGDGLYDVCLDAWGSVFPKNCSVLSFGIYFDAGFEVDLANIFNCRVYAYDPSEEARKHMNEIQSKMKISPNLKFIPEGLWGKDSDALENTLKREYGAKHEIGQWERQVKVGLRIPSHSKPHLTNEEISASTFTLPVKRLDTIMFNHSLTHVNIIKIDAEGAEWAFFADVFLNDPFHRLPCDVLLIEFHHFQSSVDSRFGSSKVIHDIIQKLHDQGLYIYSVDAYRMDSGDFYREYSFTRTAEEIKKN